MSKIALSSGLVATLLLGWALDGLLSWLRNQASRTFDPGPVYWGSILSNLLIVTAILGLAWLASVRLERSRVVSAVFLLIGLGLLGYVPLMSFAPAPISSVLQSPLLMPISSSLFQNVVPNSHLSLSLAAIAVIGVLGLLRKT